MCAIYLDKDASLCAWTNGDTFTLHSHTIRHEYDEHCYKESFARMNHTRCNTARQPYPRLSRAQGPSSGSRRISLRKRCARHKVYENLNENLSSTTQVVKSELRNEFRVTWNCSELDRAQIGLSPPGLNDRTQGAWTLTDSRGPLNMDVCMRQISPWSRSAIFHSFWRIFMPCYGLPCRTFKLSNCCNILVY